MPLFVVIGHDGPDGLARRDKNREAHVAYIEALDKAGRITFAGPIKSDDGAVSNGVVLILEAPTLDDARKVAHDDPYVQGGVYDVLSVSPIRKVFPR
ncbi:MAG: YciI family protein [Polyangiaceae bacterium]